jgi:hypothetical protein
MEQKRKLGQNQGEGNREAARRYNEATRKHVKKGDVQQQAEEAERALEGLEKDELERAEKLGKHHAKEEDPQLERDYHRPTDSLKTRSR